MDPNGVSPAFYDPWRTDNNNQQHQQQEETQKQTTNQPTNQQKKQPTKQTNKQTKPNQTQLTKPPIHDFPHTCRPWQYHQ